MAHVITTILLDDNPKGLRLIEMANWSGKAFVVPRSKLKELKARNDARQPGLYILFGEGAEREKAYIGQLTLNKTYKIFTPQVDKYARCNTM
jgi:hypothetical protein